MVKYYFVVSLNVTLPDSVEWEPSEMSHTDSGQFPLSFPLCVAVRHVS